MLARAFQDDPLSSYFFPNTSQRERMQCYAFEFMLRFSISYGEVYTTSPNLEGSAAWLPSDNDVTLWRIIQQGGLLLYFKFGRESASRQFTVFTFITSIHKRHAPFRHWYLALIGIAPSFQGKGYASTLLRPLLARLDGEHLPCYLETQNEKNVPIYQHFGFKVVEEATIPGTEIRNWAMLRGISN